MALWCDDGLRLPGSPEFGTTGSLAFGGSAEALQYLQARITAIASLFRPRTSTAMTALAVPAERRKTIFVVGLGMVGIGMS